MTAVARRATIQLLLATPAFAGTARRIGERVAITGGAGHIGINLAAALWADGHSVRVIDAVRPASVMRHGAERVRADVRQFAAMRGGVRRHHVVYHLAALISIVGGVRGLVESVNVSGMREPVRPDLRLAGESGAWCRSTNCDQTRMTWYRTGSQAHGAVARKL